MNVQTRRHLMVLSLLALAGAWWIGQHDTGPSPQNATQSNTNRFHQDNRGIASLAEWQRQRPAETARDQWLASGVRTARARRAALLELAKHDPASALGRMMTPAQLESLPAAVRAECEQPWSGTADRDLRWITTRNPDGGIDCEHQHVLSTGDVRGPAYAPHWMDAQPIRKNLCLQGYRLGGAFLISPPPAGLEKNDAGVAAYGGGAGGGDGTPQATPYMNNAINALFILVDFSDFPGPPVTQAALQSTLGNVASRLNQYSYGAASLSYTVTTQVYRLPFSGESYAVAGNNDGLITDARALAAANYSLGNYDVVGVYFHSLGSVPGSQITYAGMATIGSSNHWINGANDVGVILHEFGHNYGLFHSNYWNPAASLGGSYLDPHGSSLEYGDIFDLMGSGNEANGYFGPFSTNRLGWLPNAKVIEPAASGTWRIYRFDTPGAISNPQLALKVPMGGGVYYWVSHRKLYTSSTYNLVNGAYVVAEGLYTGRPNLIDMTPASKSSAILDRNDAGLPVGSVYYDPASGVRFETLASGGTAPNEWIDVNVQFDSRVELLDLTPETDEQAGIVIVRMRRNFGSSGTVSVNYATADGTATAGSDYYPASGTVTWGNGDVADKSVAIAIRPDTLNEGIETFSFTLSGASGAIINPASGVATIRIHDPGRRYASFAPGFFNTTVAAIVPQPDGKVLIGGTIGAGIGDAPAIRHLARLNADGTVDGTFQTGLGFNAPVKVIRQQSDGKLLVGGGFTSYDGIACNHVVRLNADGTVDSAFVTAMGNGADDNVNDIAIETSGKILLGGDFVNFNGTAANHLVRLTTTGTRDTTSPVTVDPAFDVYQINSIIAQTDGKIVIGGNLATSSYIAAADGFRAGMARLNASGARDTSFDPGAGVHDIGSRYSIGMVTRIARQADGTYLVIGEFTAYNGHAATRMVRVTANGSFDPGFAGPAFDNTPQALLVQPSGTIVVGGWFTTPASRLTRLTSSGSVDPSFNTGGNPTGPVYALAQGTNWDLWLGGNFFNYGGASSRPVVKVAAGGGDAYQTWASRNFSATQLTDGTANPTADPDHDGLTNLAEMAVGTNPMVFTNDPAFSPAAGGGVTFVKDGTSTYLQLTLNKSPSAAGLWFAAQFSDNLQAWTPVSPIPGSNTTYKVIDDTTTRIVVRDLTPTTTANRRFARIVVRKPD